MEVESLIKNNVKNQHKWIFSQQSIKIRDHLHNMCCNNRK